MWTDEQRTKTNPKPHLSNQSHKENCPTPWQPYIYKTNLFTKLHDDWAKNVTSRVKLPPGSHAKNVTSRVFTCFHYIHKEKNAPPTGGHVFSPIWTIFELDRHINKTNVLINFHDDWAKIVTSRVFTRKTAPPTDIIGTNLLTKFHEDRTINVDSRIFTNKCGRMDDRWMDGRRTKTSHKSSLEQSGELKY
ncbi:hypothetical protein DPMN_121251 [Dreissena polymorpha]|uniref:Uncharacterized protein n=1 Tax=Dreissena polymorpha TaxID=45954 RepID=A0A9D4JSX8_DREPO|nr:hypothetical protein DPMN_121251 [Dreissena polymorpha]